MNLRFDICDIKKFAERYDADLKDKEKEANETIANKIIPFFKQYGYIEKPHFLTICNWKSPRSKPRCAKNDSDFIKEVSRISKATMSERMRIEVWTLLDGVSWPTASVFLHFGFEDKKYPILDFRALWSLGIDTPPNYTFEFWQEYVKESRKLAAKAGVTMRELDKALWQYSKEKHSE